MAEAQLFIHYDPETIPWEKSNSRYSAFWKNERKKCIEGINIDGWEMSGWLYWHINHWKINTVDKNAKDSINSEILTITPKLRDNEVIVNDSLNRAHLEKRGICIMGLRQAIKTTFESSYGARAAILFKNSQNLIMGTNEEDLNNITEYIDFGLLNCTPFFRIPRISKDWSKERVLLGMKTKGKDNLVHSTFVIRNTSGGIKTEKGAGVSNLKSNLWDEIGKNDFLRALTATKPAMLGANGWICIPICVGTGGNVEKAKDAKDLFFNPDTHLFLRYDQPDGRSTGLYLPGILRSDCKYETTLGSYLISKGYLQSVPEDSELNYTTILVSDEILAKSKIESELKAYLDAGDMTNYNAWKAYYPLEIDDIFLSETNNPFIDVREAIKQQKKYLETQYQPEYVELYKTLDNEIKSRTSNTRPINKFPMSAMDIANWGIPPICIYEYPIKDVPFGTYIIGIDPYNEDKSSARINSLGTVYIYKRKYIMGEMQNCIVASWAGRHRSVKDFHELCINLTLFYNAMGGVLPENEDKTLIQHFGFKNMWDYLADSLELSREISNGKTKSSRTKGLSASTTNQEHYMKLMVMDAKEEIYLVSEDEDMIKMGVSKIPDPMLLEEMLNYRQKTKASKGIHDGNFDRIIAWGHCLTLARYYDTIYKTIDWKPVVTKEKEDYHTKEVQTFFGVLKKKNRTPKDPRNWNSKGFNIF